MTLPPTPKRAGLAVLLAIAATGLVALTVSATAGAHPGPVDTSGGHYCTQAQHASGLCRPPTYHRHEEDGNIRVVTPGPEAAQLTGQQGGQPFTPGSTPTTAPATTTPPPGSPAAAPLADTGPIDMGFALVGVLLSALGLMALVAHRRIPLPVILELDRG